jgi:hypothetical protein
MEMALHGMASRAAGRCGGGGISVVSSRGCVSAGGLDVRAFGLAAGAAASAVSGAAGSEASRAVRSMTGGFTGPPFRSAMKC